MSDGPVVPRKFCMQKLSPAHALLIFVNYSPVNKRHVCRSPAGLPWQMRMPSWMAPKLLSQFQTIPRKQAWFACIFKIVNISWGQRSVDAITGLHRPPKKHSPRSEFTPELHRWISKLTACHLQILHQIIDHRGEKEKKVSKKWKKKVKLVRVSHWSASVENAIECEIACDCVKLANVVLGLRKETFAKTHTAAHKLTSAQRKVTIGLASATSQLDRNAWQRVATYKSGSKQTWRCIFFVWNHIEKAQTDRTPAQLPLCWAATARISCLFSGFRFRAVF